MQFEESLPGVEHAPEARAEAPRRGLQPGLGHEVQVDLRPHTGELLRQQLRAFAGGVVREFVGHVRVDELRQQREVVAGRVPEAAPDDDRLDSRIHPHRDDGFFSRSDHDDVVHELILGTPPLSQLLAQRALFLRRHPLHDQHGELMPSPTTTERGFGTGAVTLPQFVADLIGRRQSVFVQGPIDLGHGLCELAAATGAEDLLQTCESVLPGICEIPLHRGEQLEVTCDDVLHGRGTLGLDRPDPPVGLLLDAAPDVQAGLPPGVVGVRVEIGHRRLFPRPASGAFVMERRGGRSRSSSSASPSSTRNLIRSGFVVQGAIPAPGAESRLLHPGASLSSRKARTARCRQDP